LLSSLLGARKRPGENFLSPIRFFSVCLRSYSSFRMFDRRSCPYDRFLSHCTLFFHHIVLIAYPSRVRFGAPLILRWPLILEALSFRCVPFDFIASGLDHFVPRHAVNFEDFWRCAYGTILFQCEGDPVSWPVQFDGCLPLLFLPLLNIE